MHFTQRAAGLWRRTAAACYDLLLLAGILMVTGLIVIIVRGGAAVPGGNPFFRLFLFAQVAVFFIAFWSRGGQTPGMRAWDLRVVTESDAPLAPARAALRFAAALLSLATLGLGLLWMLLDPQGRAWHDRLSSTRIVRSTRRMAS